MRSTVADKMSWQCKVRVCQRSMSHSFQLNSTKNHLMKRLVNFSLKYEPNWFPFYHWDTTFCFFSPVRINLMLHYLNHMCSFTENGWSSLTVHEPPVEQRVVDEGFQHSHDAVPMLPQHLHHRVAGDAVVTVQACHLAPNQKKTLQMKKNLSQHQSITFLINVLCFKGCTNIFLTLNLFQLFKRWYNFKPLTILHFTS